MHIHASNYKIALHLCKHRSFDKCSFYFFLCSVRPVLKVVVTVTEIQKHLSGCSYILSRHRQCHYTSCVVEGFIQRLDKLYANTYISFSMFYDEMYIDLLYILFVITELDLAKT